MISSPHSRPPRTASRRSGAIFDLDAARSALEELRHKAAAPDFWSAQEKAQETLRAMRGLGRRVDTAARLDEWRGELDTLGELLREGEPADADARTALSGAAAFGDELELSVKMSAPEDANNAWLSIH